jgi:hypothetical protein
VRVPWDQALAWRVARQLLAEPAGSPVEAARQVAGVQAQVMSAAELAIGIRTGAPPPVTRSALWQERTLVKTWAMRGTLHLFAADELPAWVAALRQKEAETRRTKGWEDYHGVTVAQLAAITEAVGGILGREPMTRAELAEAVAQATRDPALGQAVQTGFGGTILKSAAANGDLCFGPDRGRNVTFVEPRTWLRRGWAEPDPAHAAGLVVRRFFDAYGPATGADLARWWGVPPAQGRRMLRPLLGELVRIELGDDPAPARPTATTAWMTGPEAARLADTPPLRGHVRLVPAFDPYVLAPHGHRRHAWPEGLHARISRPAGWISPALVVDGRVAGVWSHTPSGGRVRIVIEPFGLLERRTRAAAEAHAASYEPFLGGPIEIVWAEQGLRPPAPPPPDD